MLMLMFSWLRFQPGESARGQPASSLVTPDTELLDLWLGVRMRMLEGLNSRTYGHWKMFSEDALLVTSDNRRVPLSLDRNKKLAPTAKKESGMTLESSFRTERDKRIEEVQWTKVRDSQEVSLSFLISCVTGRWLPLSQSYCVVSTLKGCSCLCKLCPCLQ